MDLPPYLTRADSGPGVLIRVKVVPGASRTRIAGAHGDRLRVNVAAPPERGRANRALEEHLARSLGLRRSDVTVVSGSASPRKTVRVNGLSPERVADLLITG